MSSEDRTWQLAGGFEELCIHVREIAPLAETLEAVGGYTRLDLPDDDPAHFPGAPEGSTRVRQVLLYASGDLRGRVRLIAFDGEGWTVGRCGARSWDPGGVFDIGLYTRDIEASWRELMARGWNAVGVPVRYGWGGFEVRQAVVLGPGGLGISLMQPVSAPLIDLPSYARWSRFFNCAQVVADYAASMRFFCDVLGFAPLVDTDVSGAVEPGQEILGLPQPWGEGVRRQIGIVHPQGGNDGSVEIFAFPGIAGKPVNTCGALPALGVVALRHRVEGLAAYHRELRARGADPSVLETVMAAPFGVLQRFFVTTPDGANLEFFQPGEGWCDKGWIS